MNMNTQANAYLSELPSGKKGRILSFEGGVGMQSRLRRLGLMEGELVEKLSHIGRGGPVIVLVNRTQVAIGRGMAKKIVVSLRD